MRRIMAIAAALALIATFASATTVAGAGTRFAVSGTWAWRNTGTSVTDLPDGSTVSNGTEASTWTGSFAGRSADIYQMITTKPGGEPGPYGPGYGTQTNVFTGKVRGRSGTMIMYVTYWWPAGDVRAYTGTWLILAGTGRLAGLTGSGTWVSATTGVATYKGSVSWN